MSGTRCGQEPSKKKSKASESDGGCGAGGCGCGSSDLYATSGGVLTRPTQILTSAFYLGSDEPEIATDVLLEEVGVRFLSPGAGEGITTSSLPALPYLECSFSVPVALFGPGCFDVRDSANSWLRVNLPPFAVALLRERTYTRAVRGVSGVVRCSAWSVAKGCVDITTDSPVPSSRDCHFVDKPQNTRELVSELCALFYTLAWVTGTGGSISIRYGARIFMAPSGVQKERIRPQDIFVLDSAGTPIYTPQPAPGTAELRLSQCSPLFQHAFTLRNAGACIHTHSISAVLVTLKCDTEFRIVDQEMIKGIAGHGYHDTLVVPIINNTPHERDLAGSMEVAMTRYPKTSAILVRRHGVYVWGDSWEAAKTQAECYHYLFDAAVKMWEIGLDPSVPEKRVNAIERSKVTSVPDGDGFRGVSGVASDALTTVIPTITNGVTSIPTLDTVQHVVLDIEGTTTPIAFVTETLFPYAKAKVRQYLTEGWGTPQVQGDVAALIAQVEADVAAGVTGVVPILTAGSVADQIQSVVSNVEWQMSSDRKAGPLKHLQGHIWNYGYEAGELKGELFSDVKPAIEKWSASGRKVYIYSSGSRQAQRLLFQYSSEGDVRPLLSGYFDTTTGPKTKASSYESIVLSLGASSPSQVLFITDSVAEAVAAKEAGMSVVISDRPGNHPLPPSHGFPIITSFAQL